ncbi:hypothetical protein [Dokdonella sp.]|uniref:hypothetical protein n=1 Tax=Dokdonella sp. TaxID=2291710 RepID=UPI002F4039DC
MRVSAEREIRTVVGLRPFRPYAFAVRAQRFGDTLVHNYGHGGSGNIAGGQWFLAYLSERAVIAGDDCMFSRTDAILLGGPHAEGD